MTLFAVGILLDAQSLARLYRTSFHKKAGSSILVPNRRQRHCTVEMCMANWALLLWSVTTARGLSTSFNCTEITPYETLLQRFRNCNVTTEDGYVHAVCNILVGLRQQLDYTSAYPETITMEQLLVSDEPADGETQEGRNVCLSLRSIKIRKWDSFPLGTTEQYDRILTPLRSSMGPFILGNLLLSVRQMTIKSTFGEPPQAAVAVCNGTRADRSCNFEVYGFIDSNTYQFAYCPILNLIYGRIDPWNIEGDGSSSHSTYNVTSIPFSFVFSAFIKFWNIYSFRTEAVNVTFVGKIKNIPRSLLYTVAVAPIKHLLFYKCNFDHVKDKDIPEISNLQSLEFFQTPIQNIHPHAFKLNPNITHSSFIGTKLSGIPEAIFDIRRLDTLDMSDTNVPRDTEFDYCPGDCQRNSTVKHLILSGTNLSSLPTRAFCGFPLLKTLELENCHITQLSESPFECLETLRSLTMASNKIRSLDGKRVKGLNSLLFFNLSNNGIANFEGPQIFSTLTSMRSLILFQNEIKDLQIGAVEHSPIEQLNLGHNKISKWNAPLFTRIAKLETLLLEHNVISSLSDDMLHDISHVKYVNLSWNPWDCSSCQLKNLRAVLEKNSAECAHCFLCKEPEELDGRFVLEAPRNEDDCGPPDYFRVYGVPALLSIMAGSLAGYGIYRNRWYCMYGLLYLKLAVRGRRRQAHAGRFLWDGFISYHASDGEWVREVLLPKLESAPMSFRLCVAERDFIPGVAITENICRAISQSRVSLFVLSREFCRSRWCMFELSLAQHRLFEDDRQENMVLIRKNDMEVSEMSTMLAYLIKSRTYVQLPPDGSSEALNNIFWLQVQSALEK